MPLNIGKFIADPKPQEEGVWINFDEDQGVAFKIAYIGNAKYERKFSQLSLKARRKTRGRELDPRAFTQLTNTAMIGTILLDWRGLKDDDKEFTFNEENAERLLKESKVFRDFIQEEAMILDNFQTLDTEAKEDGPTGDLKSGARLATGTVAERA